MAFVFSTYEFSPPLTTSNFYAHVVTAVPSEGALSVAQLALPTTTVGYSSLPLTITTSVSSGVTYWNVQDATWSSLNWAQTIVGICIAVRAGANPDPSDPVWLFFDFQNNLGESTSYVAGRFGVRFSTSGQPLHISQPGFKYDVGNFSGFPLYGDIVSLIRSSNNLRYTPGGAVTSGYMLNGVSLFDLTPKCYVVGNANHSYDFTDRHDLAYNNITFPVLSSLKFGFNKLATFNGVDSYITVGNTTTNGADFTLTSGNTASEFSFLLYIIPAVSSTQEILLDTTTNNSSGGYVVRKTPTNAVEVLFITAGSPHTAEALTSTNALDIGSGNLIYYSSQGTARSLWLNSVRTAANSAFGGVSPTLTNGIRLGARRGLVPAITGSNFSGALAYFISGASQQATGAATMSAIANRDTRMPYNNQYFLGWGQTGLNVAGEMTSINSFPARKNVFVKSVGNLNTDVASNNLVANGGVLNQMRIDLPECFYVNFGKNKVKIGKVAIPFPTTNLLANVKLDTAANSATFCIWATNSLALPSNANLTNPAKWSVFEYVIPGFSITGDYTDLSLLTPLVASGSYRFYILDTSNISKHYRYYRMGWKNAVATSPGGGGVVNGFGHYLFYNSSVLTADLNLIPSNTSYSI